MESLHCKRLSSHHNDPEHCNVHIALLCYPHSIYCNLLHHRYHGYHSLLLTIGGLHLRSFDQHYLQKSSLPTPRGTCSSHRYTQYPEKSSTSGWLRLPLSQSPNLPSTGDKRWWDTSGRCCFALCCVHVHCSSLTYSTIYNKPAASQHQRHPQPEYVPQPTCSCIDLPHEWMGSIHQVGGEKNKNKKKTACTPQSRPVLPPTGCSLC